MQGGKALSTPIQAFLKLNKEDAPKSDVERVKLDKVPYSSAVGSLMYAMVATRPHIAFAMGVLSRYMSSSILEVLSSRLYVSSTTKAKYISLSDANKEAVWLSRLVKNLGIDETLVIYCDSQSALALARNPVFHSKSKHIEVRYHLVRDFLFNKLIDLVKVHIDDNPADALIKALALERFTHCSELMDIGPPARPVLPKLPIASTEEKLKKLEASLQALIKDNKTKMDSSLTHVENKLLKKMEALDKHKSEAMEKLETQIKTLELETAKLKEEVTSLKAEVFASKELNEEGEKQEVDKVAIKEEITKELTMAMEIKMEATKEVGAKDLLANVKPLHQCPQQSSRKRSLSLRLDYEDVINSSSDRGSLWMDGQRPQIVPDVNFLDHGITDSGMVMVAESSCNISMCSQAGQIPSGVIFGLGANNVSCEVCVQNLKA
ncbi:hypothetical protein L7F22_005863 [Adiantum nelumboides]|nr:hypothetical protein [Adiantum nelumboides]